MEGETEFPENKGLGRHEDDLLCDSRRLTHIRVHNQGSRTTPTLTPTMRTTE